MSREKNTSSTGVSARSLEACRIAMERIQVVRHYRKDLGDLDALAASLRENGLIQPIILNRRLELVAGLRRLRAAQRLGWKDIPAYISDAFDDLIAHLKAEYAENTCRKELTPSEAVHMTSAIWSLEQKRSREKQKLGRSASGHSARHGYQPRELETFDLPENFREVEGSKSTLDTRDRVAKVIGMSGRTLEKARTVVEAAEKDPGTYGSLREQMDKTGKIDKAYREVRAHKNQSECALYEELNEWILSSRKSLGSLFDRWVDAGCLRVNPPSRQRQLLLNEMTMLLDQIVHWQSLLEQ